MADTDDPFPIWKQEPVKLVIVEYPEPDEDDDLQQMLDAIRAAKDPGTELNTTVDPEQAEDDDQC